MAVDRGNGVGVAQAEIVEFVKFRRDGAEGIAFIDAQHHRLAAFLQQMGDFGVVGGHAGFQIHYKEDDVGGIDGDLGLHAHLAQQQVVGLRFDAAGIHQHEFPAAPFAGGVDAVPGDAGGILHDGKPLAGEFIEQGGFTDIGPADHRDQWLGHIVSLPFGGDGTGEGCRGELT